MAMVINSNIASLNAQRHLNSSLEAQNTATERLSSGLRINSAADDAAGLAIVNRMTSQVEGLNQAIRNANDGQALIQTAEGGLEETTNILQRMRELSIQSANGTYDTGNRTTLNAEVEQLQAEIDRIAETTSFNGLNILDGSLGEINLQVGENANQTIALEVGSLTTNNLGDAGADLIGTSGTAAGLLEGLNLVTASVLEINDDYVQSLTGAANLAEAVSLLNDSVAGIEISSFVELVADAETGGNGALSGNDELVITVESANSTTSHILNINDTADLQDIVDRVNSEGNGFVSASLDDNGMLALSSETGASIIVTGVGDGLANSGFAATATQEAQLKFEVTDSSIENIDVVAATTVANLLGQIGLNKIEDGKVTGASATGMLADNELVLNGVSVGAGTGTSLADTAAAINRVSDESNVTAIANTTTNTLELASTDGSPISIEAGDGATGTTDEAREADLQAVTGLQVMNQSVQGSSTVASIDISTQEGAQRAISILDEAISQVSELRGDLGAVSNRLDYTTSNLANISENAASARSQIQDADFAEESANLSRAQVLQQAGNAMLAQANSRPQQVLSLLQ